MPDYLFTPDDIRAAQLRPKYCCLDTDWIGHIPFAGVLMDWHSPGSFVELGVRRGQSFAAFCQAREELGLKTQCFGVDHWKGDEQSRHSVEGYPDSIYDEAAKAVEPYQAFARLMRMSFAEAAQHFKPGTVDLLHIDGYHAYQAVRTDFYTWLPKMSYRGIVLFHDTAHSEWGAWQAFLELKQYYPVFNFHHCGGLGIVAVGSGPYDYRLVKLFNCGEEDAKQVRDYFEKEAENANTETS